MSTTTAPINLSTLTEDGDTLDLGNGLSLRLRVEPDECGSVMDDGDWHGDLKWGGFDRYTGRSVRPDGFDGSAEKILTDSGDALWWAPPADAVRDAELRDRLRSSIVALYHQGYNVVTLELRETLADHAGHPHTVTVESASIGMVALIGETTEDDVAHVQELLSDLIYEVLPNYGG